MPQSRRRHRTTSRREIDMALFKHGIHTDALHDRIQRGGGVRCGKKSGVVSANGFRYTYTCYEDDENTLLFNGGNRRPCFVLTIRPAERSATLITLERSSSCSLDTGATTQSAGKAAFILAAERGVKRITLTDNAVKPMGAPDNKFVVSDMEFLTQGRSWYETFLPVVPTIDLEPSRAIVRNNTWDSVFACLRQKDPAAIVPVDISDINTTKQGSAMTVLQRIKEGRTDFFARYRWFLPLCSGVPTLHGMEWVAEL